MICKHPDCKFVAVGRLCVVSATDLRTTYTFGVCALHRDDVARDAIESPRVASVEWEPRTDWANDGAAA